MSNRVDLEEIESTRSEKALAFVLVAFLLIGTIWFYVKVDNWIVGTDPSDWEYTEQEQSLIDNQTKSWDILADAQREVELTKADADLARDNLNLAISKGQPTAELQDKYEAAQDDYEAARVAETTAHQESKAADAAVAAMEKERMDRLDNRDASDEWIIAGIRFGFILAWILAGYRLLATLRERQSRFLALGFSVLGAGVITALVFATDYILEWIDPLDLGPIVLSVVGVIATVIAFITLQRYLAKRIPARRVRKGDCPFCGYPIRGGVGEDNCEGCGREVIAPCAHCSAPRRVGSTHCASCGKN